MKIMFFEQYFNDMMTSSYIFCRIANVSPDFSGKYFIKIQK